MNWWGWFEVKEVSVLILGLHVIHILLYVARTELHMHTMTFFVLSCFFRKRFRSKHSHYKDGHSYVTSGEFSLDPIKDHSLLEQDEENGEHVCVCLFVSLSSSSLSLSLSLSPSRASWS